MSSTYFIHPNIICLVYFMPPVFILHVCIVCPSDYHQSLFSTLTPSQTDHLWHHTLVSGGTSVASPHPTTLPTPSFVSRTKLILFTQHPTDLFHKQDELEERRGHGGVSHPACQPNKPPFLCLSVKPICWRQH